MKEIISIIKESPIEFFGAVLGGLAIGIDSTAMAIIGATCLICGRIKSE